MGSLSNLYISQSYTSLVHLGNDGPITDLLPGQFIALQDGLGNSLNIELNGYGDVNIGGILSASNIPTDIATQAELNAYTASTNIRLNNLETTSASVNVSVNALNIFTASQSSASVVASINNLNQFSASALTSISNLNASSASQQISINSLNSATSSYANSASVAAVDAAQQQSINSLNAVTSSFLTASTDISQLNAFTQSANIRLNNLESTSASVNVSVNNLNIFSASAKVSIDALNTFTASQSTASIVTSIDNLNQFSASALVSINNINSTTASLNSATASLFGSASLALVTASFDNGTRNLTFTKGDSSIFAVNIPDVSGSSGNFVTTSSFNAYTASNDQRVSSLEANSASVNISITNLNSTTASLNSSITQLNASSASHQVSINALNSATSSLFGSASLGLTTASFDNGTRNLTFTKGDTTTFSVNIPDVSGSAGNFVTTASFNAYTQSNDQRVGSLEVNSASVNVFTQSTNIRLNNLENTSASVNVSITNLNSTTSSLNTSISNLNASSASQQVSIDALNVFTASQSTASIVNSINQLNSFSASAKISISALNSFTQSQEGVNVVLAGEIDSLQAKTGSYATTGSNNFIGNQTIIGNISAFSASFTYLQTIYESSSIIYSSGSNQFGDELTDVQTLSGSVKIQGSLTVNGVPVQTSSVDISALNQATASLQAFTASAQIRLNNLELTTQSINSSISQLNASSASQQISIDALNTNSASVNISITNVNSATASLFTSVNNINSTTASLNTSVNALNTFTASQSTASIVTSITNLNQFTQSANQRLGSLEAVTSSYATTGSNTFRGINQFITGAIFNESLNVSITAGRSFIVNNNGLEWDGTSDNKPATFKSYVNITNDLNVTGSLTASLQQGYVWVGNASNKTSLVPTSSLVSTIDTGSFVTTSSFNSYTASTDVRLNNLESTTSSLNTSITNINSFTSSANQRLTAIENVSGSWVTSAVTASSLVTASFDNGTRNLTFTKGDSSTFSVNIPDVSGSVGSGATLGANTFTGSQTISLSNGEFRVTNPDFPSYGSVAFGLSNASQGGIYFKQSGSILFEGAPSDNRVTFYGTGSFTRGVQIGPNEQFGNNLFIIPNGSLVGLGYPSGSVLDMSIIVGKAIDNTPTRFKSVDVTIDNDLVITGSFTASIQNGYTWVGNSLGVTTAVPTSSFVGTQPFPYTGDAEITGSLVVTETITTQIFLNPQILTGTQTIPTGYNGMVTGPISNSGTIIIESGSTLVII